MDGFVAFIPFMIVFGVIISVVKSANKQAAKGASANRTTPMTNEEVRARLEKARMERLAQARAQAEFRQGAARRQDPSGKPIIPHSTDDCTGGSIHDGYHEGTVRRPAAASSAEGNQGAQGARRASYAPGRTGQGMQSGEGVSAYAAKPAAAQQAQAGQRKSGTEKLAEMISGKPAIVQGVIWSEVLGRPLSE